MPLTRRSRSVAAGTALVLALVGCGHSAKPNGPQNGHALAPIPAPGDGGPADAMAVGFRAADGLGLRGRMFGRGQAAVVLAHMGNAVDDESDWYALAHRLAREGYMVLVYNRRGVCTGTEPGYDCSAGQDDYATAWKDVVGAVAFVRSRGAREVAGVGASIGATSTLYAAKTGRVRLGALVALAGVNYISTYSLTAADLATIPAAKLFVAGRDDDALVVRSNRQWFAWARHPKRLVLLQSDRHGTDMLAPAEPTRRGLTELIVRFLKDAMAPRPG